MKLNITYDGQTISVADGQTLTLKCAGLKARSNIRLEAVADVVEPTMQTLTVINSNNESETASFTMPSGYTFEDFVDSDYDTSGGAFTILNDSDVLYFPQYNGYNLYSEGGDIQLIEYTASGTFYYAGESATTYQLSGTWVFNETLTIDDYLNAAVSFVCNSIEYDEITTSLEGSDQVMWYHPIDNSGGYYGDTEVYDDSWNNQLYRTITFDGTQTVSQEFYEWFTANASSGEFEQISGTWTWNENIDGFDEGVDIDDFSLSFISNNMSYTRFQYFDYDTQIEIYYDDTIVYNEGSSMTPSEYWQNEAYRTFSIQGSQLVPSEFATWLRAFAVRQDITFTINDTTYQAEDGMTWAEWVVDTTLNTGGFYLADGDLGVKYPTNNTTDIIARADYQEYQYSTYTIESIGYVLIEYAGAGGGA